MTNDSKAFTAYERDNPRTDSGGWIQWKGTHACIDLHCVCGHDGHADADFLYQVKCPVCGREFFVGQNVKLIELTPDEAAASVHASVLIQGDLP